MGRQKPAPARSRGQPSKYHRKYCKWLITHGKGGRSIETFAAVVGVNRSTIYDWVEAYPEFKAAKELSQASAEYYWEGRLIIADRRGDRPIAAIFTMKCRFGWRDGGEPQKPEAPKANELYETEWGSTHEQPDDKKDS